MIDLIDYLVAIIEDEVFIGTNNDFSNLTITDNIKLRISEDENLKRINSVANMFNGLSAAQIERLAILTEEMGESLQVIGKVLRHGYKAEDPYTQIQYDNKKDLETELGQVKYSIASLAACDLDWQTIEDAKIDRHEKLKKYNHHQE